MAKKVFNMEGGLHSANAFTAFEARAYGSCVANATSLKVVPAGGMNVRVSIGDGIIDGQTPRRIQIDAPETIALTPASTSYARKDLIVAYIDSGVPATTSVIDNINNILKIIAVNGTPSAVPATPSDSEIQAKIGAGNQYMILAEIIVARSDSSIGDGAIFDRRNVITAVPAESLTGKISGSQIANQTITSDNINFATLKNYNSTMPRKSQTVGIGYGLEGRFLRIGDLVQVSISKVIQSSSNGDGTKMVEIVPADFQPIQTAHVSVQAVAGASSDRNLDIRFEPDGTIYHSGANITTHTRFTGSAMFFAKNPMS